jgi:16S rRNA (cytosine967-C5)-methyltransferase
MLSDNSPGVRLLATDVRESILQNLSARFRQYSLPLPERLVLDASDANVLATALKDRKFQGIICDVPCTGSGTWARTPESCYFFKTETLEHYTSRQQAILRNAAQFLAPGGRLVYITCSVFRAENEDVVNAVAVDNSLKVESVRLINGMPIQADSLFAAVLVKT